MSKSRMTVTVRPEILSIAEKQVAGGRARSVSAWVDSAMEEKARRDELVALLAEMREEAGSTDSYEEEAEEAEEWARSVLGL
jgi:hypothetical protein